MFPSPRAAVSYPPSLQVDAARLQCGLESRFQLRQGPTQGPRALLTAASRAQLTASRNMTGTVTAACPQDQLLNENHCTTTAVCSIQNRWEMAGK